MSTPPSNEKCPQVGDIIHCGCGKPSSHYGTMGYRGAREVREVSPVVVQTSNEKVDELLVTLGLESGIYRSRVIVLKWLHEYADWKQPAHETTALRRKPENNTHDRR